METRTITIGGRIIGPRMPVFVIAEAGVNHDGDVEKAKTLVEAAAMAGADAVKFQTFKAENMASRLAGLAEYQEKIDPRPESMLDLLKALELTREDHEAVWEHARKRKITVLSSPYDVESVDLLEDLGVPAYKIGSGEITNLELLRHVEKKGKPVILSTGMSTLDEIEAALRLFKVKVALLQCVSSYHTPYEDANLRALKTLEEKFKVPVGYSDHTIGVEIPVAAVALGACIVEKHLTLDRAASGPDHKASLEPDEFGRMVEMIRHVSQGLGDGVKRPSEVERDSLRVARKSLVAARDITMGEILERKDVAVKRPGTGISPMSVDEIIGKKVMKNVKADALFKWSDFKLE